MNAVPRVQPGQCVVCRLAESGHGYHPFGGRKKFTSDQVAWVCDADLPFAKAWFQMSSKVRDKIEQDALAAAAKQTGDYFDRVGKASWNDLTWDEYETAFAVFLEYFGSEMRTRLGNNTAPF